MINYFYPKKEGEGIEGYKSSHNYGQIVIYIASLTLYLKQMPLNRTVKFVHYCLMHHLIWSKLCRNITNMC
jgi:hypothetical protein